MDLIDLFKKNKLHSSSLALYLIQSLIPCLILINYFLSFINISSSSIFDFIYFFLPTFSKDQILDFLSLKDNIEVSLFILILSINVIARGFRILEYSVFDLYNFKKKPLYYRLIKSYIISVVFLFLVSVFITIFLTLVSSILIIYILTFIMVFIIYSFLLIVISDFKLKMKDVYVGCIISSFLILMLFLFISFLNFKIIKLNSLYGSLSWVFIFLFVFHLISYLILIGLIINFKLITK